MSTIHHFKKEGINYAWEGVTPRKYETHPGVMRHILIGENEDSKNFIIRYFSVEPGRVTNLERHPHEHGVVVMHGRARVQLNDDFFEVGPMDAIYITGNDLHQFTNIGDDPFGFICVIKAR